MKRLLFTLLFILLPTFVFAQASPTDRFVWSMPHTAPVAQAFRYDIEIDAAVLPTPLVVTCTGAATPTECSAPIPAVTPSSHVARIRATDTTVPPITGPWSDPFTFTMRVVPGKPGPIRIAPGTP